jgi:hypothetical protein
MFASSDAGRFNSLSIITSFDPARTDTNAIVVLVIDNAGGAECSASWQWNRVVGGERS